MATPQKKLNAEAEAMIKQIEEAFKGVNRKGGVSWSEAHVLDDYGDLAERLKARKEDKDKDWHELLRDPKWQPDSGHGGWAFLDPIGFRYYLPAAMIRSVQQGYDAGISFWLTLAKGRGGDLEDWSKFTPKQRYCVRSFVLYMLSASKEEESECGDWRLAFESYWSRVPKPKGPLPRPPALGFSI